MPVAAGHGDSGDMNQVTGVYQSVPSYKSAPGPAGQDSGMLRRDARALVAVPVFLHHVWLLAPVSTRG